jgi:DNA-binding winged helix-turn-helix (wHTH) protein
MQPVAIYRFDGFALDMRRGLLRGPAGEDLPLPPKAFELLRHLLENPGLQRREALLDALWPDQAITDDNLTQCVSELRRAFGARATALLRTVPRRGYMLAVPVLREAAGPGAAPPAGPAGAIPAVRPCTEARHDIVVVHPFESPAGDTPAALLAGAFAAELTGECAGLEEVRLIPAPAAQVAEGYRLQGMLHPAGQAPRIALCLEDIASGAVLWAQQEALPADEIAPAMIGQLALRLGQEIDRQSLLKARAAPDATRTARQLCLLGRDHHRRGTQADTLLARDFFDRAMRADPDYAMPFAWQAYTVHRAITHGWGQPDGQAARDLTLSLARRAVELAPDSPLCLSRLAFALMLHRHWEPALEAARLALNAGRPVDHGSRNTCCEVLAHAGHPEEAAEAVRPIIAFDPHSPPTSHAALGRALLLAGRVEEALPELRRCAARLPDYAPALHSLVVAGVETGRMEEARAALREVFRLRPDWTPRDHFFRHDGIAERFVAAFRAAGWVETAA